MNIHQINEKKIIRNSDDSLSFSQTAQTPDYPSCLMYNYPACNVQTHLTDRNHIKPHAPVISQLEFMIIITVSSQAVRSTQVICNGDLPQNSNLPETAALPSDLLLASLLSPQGAPKLEPTNAWLIPPSLFGTRCDHAWPIMY